MKHTWKPDRRIRQWLNDIKDCKFAFVKTDDAEYSRAAVVSENENNLIVEFPRSTGNKDSPWKIVRNIIPKDKIKSIQYYV